MLLSADVGHFSLVRAMHLADLITLMNGFCGVMSIFSSLRYCLGDPNEHANVWIALAFLPFGLFFDFFDGRVARWRHKSSLMGQELDSLADLSQYFEGTPIPTSLGVDAIMAYWLYNGSVLDHLPLGVWLEGSVLEFHPVALIFVLHGCMMTSRTIRIPKP
ncbi:hypothetical protein RJ55_07795 [Drechmeria coniospora]|nr:hypothetical protein RJ55_07795 [Drechmeria coniospora]